MALTKAEMAERLFEEVGLNKREAKEFVDAFFEVVRGALERGQQVKLSGFGNFDLRKKNQRPGRNPKTGREIPISARRVVTFRPGQKLKVRVVPHLSESVSLAGALIGGPVAGVAAFLAQKLLKDPLEQLVAFEYNVSGSWSDPRVAKVERPTVPIAESGQ